MSTTLDRTALAAELMAAYADRRIVTAPSTRDSAFDMADAYAVESELVRLRLSSGRKTTGLKVGYANKAMWRALKLETLVWAHMYDDTVEYSTGNSATVSLTRMVAPKIEPEIVFKVARPVAGSDPVEILDGVEWVALGFEIIDCVYPEWRFQPADFVAAYGLHAALVVGEQKKLDTGAMAAFADQLSKFKLRLLRNGELVEEGAGRNSLRNPALCLGELARVAPLTAGELVSSGTLTTPTLIRAGEEWSAEVEGIDLPGFKLTTVD